MSLTLNTKHRLAQCAAKFDDLTVVTVAGPAAPIFGSAHQQRRRRRCRSCHQHSIHHADQRHESGREQCERRHLRGADGGRRFLSTLTDNLQSIRTLAVESANGSNSSSDRAALDQEVQQQIAEITRIASQTSFNGQNVLDGTSGVTTYQVGANVGDTIAINLSQGVRADQIGQVATSTGSAVGTTALTTANPVTIQVGTNTAVSIGATQAGSASMTNSLGGESASSAYAKVAAINAAGVAGLTASADTSTTGTFGTVDNSAGTNAATYDLSINGTAIYSGTGNLAAGQSLSAGTIASQINLYSSATGVTASVSGGNLTLDAADGRDINVQQTITARRHGARRRQHRHRRRQHDRVPPPPPRVPSPCPPRATSPSAVRVRRRWASPRVRSRWALRPSPTRTC